jgi:hypothetical protein
MLRLAQPGRPLPHLRDVDSQVLARLSDYASQDHDRWTFSERTSRVEEARALFQYPAMMVGTMQRELMASIVEFQSGVTRVVDPFAGAGTVQAEAMFLGLDVVSQDINPLAVLLCRIKGECVDPARIGAAGQRVLEKADADVRADSDVVFAGLTKWFRPEAVIEMARLRRAIKQEADPQTRRFLWATLAETVRLTSNSRTSTYKLHLRPRQDIESLPGVLATFRRLLRRNIVSQQAFHESLRFRDRIREGAYTGSVRVVHGDTTQGLDGEFDLLVTSPPYGDNGTTVPYGQASYLALRWIDLADISADAGPEWLRTTLEIDRRSLGGKSALESESDAIAALRKRSPSLAAALDKLSELPRDRARRVLAFTRDLDTALGPIVSSIRENGYLIWTVGNRRVGGIEIPLDSILTELLSSRRVLQVASVDRRITAKRMATRNTIAATMTHERTLVYRKQAPFGSAR